MGTPEILLHTQLIEPKGKNTLAREGKDSSAKIHSWSRVPLSTLLHMQNEFDMELGPQQTSRSHRESWKSKNKTRETFCNLSRDILKETRKQEQHEPRRVSDTLPLCWLPELHICKQEHCCSRPPGSHCTQRFSHAWSQGWRLDWGCGLAGLMWWVCETVSAQSRADVFVAARCSDHNVSLQFC